MLPVIARELRAESRRPWNYWARVSAGALVILALGLPALLRTPASVTGIQLFDTTGAVVILLIWTVAPLLTADCLSREKREGTLGLLFLTPLTPVDIVIGKSLVHGLRAASVSLAAIPTLAIALLFGGVSGAAILINFVHQAEALSLALAAGLLASAWSRDWIRSVILTVCLTALFAGVYYGSAFQLRRSGSLPNAAFLVGLALLLLGCAILLAARRVRDTWQEGPPPWWTLWLFRTFCSPLFWKEQFRSAMRRHLERDPLGWLHERKATARLSKWMWCLGAVLLSCAQVSSPRLVSFVMFEFALLVAMAFAGAASFRRERHNGILELLLVAPLTFEEIVHSRVGALRKQFVPAVLVTALPTLLLALWAGGFAVNTPVMLPQLVLLVTSVITLPRLGLYFSLSGERFLKAWALTCLVGIGAPFLLAGFLTERPSPRDASILGMTAILQLGLSHVATKALLPKLHRSGVAQATA